MTEKKRKPAFIVDLALSLTILAAGFTGGIVAEAKAGLYSRMTGEQSAQAGGCGQQAAPDPEAAWEELPEITIKDASPAFVYGQDNAPLHVQIFLDYECPFSQLYVRTVLPELLKREDVRLEFHDFPLPNHPNAYQAAQAGRCAAQQGGYIEFLLALAGYQTPDSKAITEATQAAGLNVEELLQCIPTEESSGKIDFNAGQQAGVDGTPTTVINGRGISGAFEWTVFERLLNEAQP